jgi:hypothetical protein
MARDWHLSYTHQQMQSSQPHVELERMNCGKSRWKMVVSVCWQVTISFGRLHPGPAMGDTWLTGVIARLNLMEQSMKMR